MTAKTSLIHRETAAARLVEQMIASRRWLLINVTPGYFPRGRKQAEITRVFWILPRYCRDGFHSQESTFVPRVQTRIICSWAFAVPETFRINSGASCQARGLSEVPLNFVRLSQLARGRRHAVSFVYFQRRLFLQERIIFKPGKTHEHAFQAKNWLGCE